MKKALSNIKRQLPTFTKLWHSLQIPVRFRKIRKRGLKDIPSFWWIVLIWCASVGLAIPIAGQLSTPFHILTHEFTQLYTILTIYLLYFLARWSTKKVVQSQTNISPIEQMRKSFSPLLAGILVMGITTMIVMFIANAASWGCLFHRGVPFFWVTWLPPAALSAVGGILVGMRGWGWLKSFLLIELLVSLSFIQDLFQFLSGARLTDFIIGDPLALDQRAEMDISEVHFFQRLFVMLVAYCLWHWGLWRSGRKWTSKNLEVIKEQRGVRRKALLSSALLVVLAAGLGSHIGIGWGRAALHSELSATHHTEHFIFQYSPGGNAETRLEAIASGAEWYWHRLSTHWNVTLNKPVKVYIFDEYDQLRRLTGMGGAHALFNKIFIGYSSASSRTFYHELVHALHQAGFQPKLTVWFNRGIVEGLAEAYEDELVWLPEAHLNHAGALRAGKLPSAKDFMSPLGFWKVEERLAYDSAASFIGFLIYQYGPGTFHKFQKTLNYKRAFGKDLLQLDSEWKRFLETLPVDVDTQVMAGDYFDAAYWGAYSRECCPKLGERHPDIEARARLLWRHMHYNKAYLLFKELYETTGAVQWGYQAALCLQRLHLYEDALALVENLRVRDNLSHYERIKILKARTSILIALRDWAALYASFEELASLEEAKPTEDQQIIESLLHNPDFRETVAESLFTEDRYEQQRLLEELSDAYPDNPDIQYLYVSRGFELNTIRGGGATVPPARETRIRALLKSIDRTPDALDRHFNTLMNHAVAAIQARNFDLAKHIGETLRRVSTDSLHRFLAARLMERLEFELRYVREHSGVHHSR